MPSTKVGPGAIGRPCAPSSSRSTCHARSLSNGAFDVCSDLSASHTSTPTMSGRCESVCPSLTATGPSAEISVRSTSPRVRSVAGSASSRSHTRCSFLYTRANLAARPMRATGRFMKKLVSWRRS